MCAKVCRVAAKGWRADAENHCADAGPQLRLREEREGGETDTTCQNIPTPNIPPCAITEPQPGEGVLGTAPMAAVGAAAIIEGGDGEADLQPLCAVDLSRCREDSHFLRMGGAPCGAA